MFIPFFVKNRLVFRPERAEIRLLCSGMPVFILFVVPLGENGWKNAKIEKKRGGRKIDTMEECVISVRIPNTMNGSVFLRVTVEE